MPKPTEPEKPKFIPGREFKEPPPGYAEFAGSNAEVRDELAKEAEEQRARDIAGLHVQIVIDELPNGGSHLWPTK